MIIFRLCGESALNQFTIVQNAVFEAKLQQIDNIKNIHIAAYICIECRKGVGLYVTTIITYIYGYRDLDVINSRVFRTRIANCGTKKEEESALVAIYRSERAAAIRDDDYGTDIYTF